MADTIEQLNAHYRQIADESGAIYVDLWPALADSNRALRRDFTLERLPRPVEYRSRPSVDHGLN